MANVTNSARRLLLALAAQGPTSSPLAQQSGGSMQNSGVIHAAQPQGGIVHGAQVRGAVSPNTAESEHGIAVDRKYHDFNGYSASERRAARAEYARRHGLDAHTATWDDKTVARARRLGLIPGPHGQIESSSGAFIDKLLAASRSRNQSQHGGSMRPISPVQASSPVVSGQGGRHPQPAGSPRNAPVLGEATVVDAMSKAAAQFRRRRTSPLR